MTFRNDHIKDLKKVQAKFTAIFKDELADATIDPKNYKNLMEEHLSAWHEQAYATMEPVRFIGLQVCTIDKILRDLT